MWYTYILFSEKIDKYYTGYCENLHIRLERHNSGWGKYSSRGIPWRLVYHEEFEDKGSAIKREYEIKNKKSRKYIEELIYSSGGRPGLPRSLVDPAIARFILAFSF